MLARNGSFFSPPVFEDQEKTRRTRLLNTVLLALIVAMIPVIAIITILYGLPTDPEGEFTLVTVIVVVALASILLLLNRRGHVRLASTVLIGAIWLVITTWVLTAAGIKSDSSLLAYPLIIALAGLLLGGQAAILATLLSALVVSVAYYLEATGQLVVHIVPVTIMDPVLTIVQLVLTGLLLRYAINSMVGAIHRAQENERAQIQANQELKALRDSLELRVADRTRDLERRAVQLQAATEVGRAVTSILDAEQLMWQTAELIADRFALYHVGIFRLDAAREWAEYRAGAGEASRNLADQGFRLQVGGDSVVGWCTVHAEVRVVHDSESELARVDHPLLPQTRSEAALPLIARGEVIGALNVQNDRPESFDSDTVATLQTIADQVAVALDNVRLFAESQDALEAIRRAYGELTREAWTEVLRTRGDWGFSYMHQTVRPAEGDWQPEMRRAVKTGQSITGTNNGEHTLSIPLKVRQEVVGVLGFCKKSDDPDSSNAKGFKQQNGDNSGWTSHEKRLLERLVEQMGLALESAQFYEETQRRAVREQVAREVTARMRETLDVETVLKTTAQQVRQALELPEVVIQLQPSQSRDGEGHQKAPSEE
jgi:GAF domain-containing protein